MVQHKYIFTMETQKNKSNVKAPPRSRKSSKLLEVINVAQVPGEEEIRKIAHELYSMRIEQGREGTAEDDWFAAKEYLGRSAGM
jgi:hypothetical protein